jgi:uncharacterized membrane protein
VLSDDGDVLSDDGDVLSDDGDVLSDDGVAPSGDGGGYTPFEFIEFTNIPMKHEVSIAVDRPVGDCYKVWESRINWMQWFDMIDEVGFHEEEPSYMSMYMWYRWATTPFLELYVTLDRTQEEENKYILEEPVEGFPLVAAVLFTEDVGGEDVGGEDGGGTIVTLRVSYLLPKVLHEFAGQLAVYGDVNRKLETCMEKMKSVVEAVDMQVLEEMKKENEEEIKAGFVEQRKKKGKKGAGARPEASLKDMSETVASEVEDVLLEEESVEEKGKAVRGGRKSSGGLRRNPGRSGQVR